jgi:protein tyrosine/serine phosphatase
MNDAAVKRIHDGIPKNRVATIGAPILVLLLAVSFLAAANSSSPTSPAKTSSSITIKNFGKMDEHFYRGAQPGDNEYKELADLGVKTIIDLRDDPLPYAKGAAESAKLAYFNIPMSDKDYPKDADIDAFLKLSNDEKNWPFYVHCAGGRHRTGLIGAMYRFNHDGWDYARAYAEMKNYDFYTRWGHGAIKKYVEDYWQRFQAKKSPPTSGNNKQS